MRRYSGGHVCGLVQGVAFGRVFPSCCRGCARISGLLRRRANGDLEMFGYLGGPVCPPVQDIAFGCASVPRCRGCARIFELLCGLGYRNRGMGA